MYRPLVAYHEWLHLDRRVDGCDLAIQIRPWETGLDNSPPLLELLGRWASPWWLDLMARSHVDQIGTRLRWDTKYVPAEQRSSTFQALALYAALRRIRWHRYDTNAALRHGSFVMQDLTYKSILVRANARLHEIGHEIGLPLPTKLASAMRSHQSAMAKLRDADTGSYYSRDARSGQLIKEQSIAGFMPLYAGCADRARATRLVQRLGDPGAFGSAYPVPTVPLDSRWFQPYRYWQGPTWINMNWLIIDGLRRYGFAAEADALRLKTLALVAYYRPVSGEPAGVKDFSWTAALIIDLLADDRTCPAVSA